LLKRVASGLVVKTLDYEQKGSRFQSHKHQRIFLSVNSALPQRISFTDGFFHNTIFDVYHWCLTILNNGLLIASGISMLTGLAQANHKQKCISINELQYL